MADMESFVGIGLRELDHDALTAGRGAAKFQAFGQNGVDDALGVLSRGEVQVEVSFDRLDAFETDRRTERSGKFLRQFDGTQVDVYFLPGSRFLSSELEERCGDAPLTIKWNPTPGQFRFGDLIRFAEREDLRFNLLSISNMVALRCQNCG